MSMENLKISEIMTLEAAQEVFPLFSQLRPEIDEPTFLDRFQEAKETGKYTLLSFYQEDNCVALMGYRIICDFVHGRHLYVDDLVVTSNLRSKGIGKQILDLAKEIGLEKGCRLLRLSTGIDNNEAKGFYERIGMSLRAVTYKSKI